MAANREICRILSYIQRQLRAVLLCLFVFTSAFAQGKEDTRRSLFKIKQAYQKINRETHYRVVTIDDPEDFLAPGEAPDGGAELKGYFKQDTLCKITEWAGLSNRTLQYEYYFDGGQLVFVYLQEKRYALKSNGEELDEKKLIPGYSGRYYFNNGKLIDSILSDTALEKTKVEDAAMLVSDGKRFAAMLRKK